MQKEKVNDGLVASAEAIEDLDSLIMECKNDKKKLLSMDWSQANEFLYTRSLELLEDRIKKLELSREYVEGLLNHGGPSTDVFIKMFGHEKTEKLYKTILFGLEI